MSSFVLFFCFSVWCMRVCACSSPCRHTQTPKDVFLGHSLPYLFRVRVSLASLVDAHYFGDTSLPAGPWNFVPVPPSVKGLQMCAAWHFFVLFFFLCVYLGFELKSSCLCSTIHPLSHVVGPWISLHCKYRQSSGSFHKHVGTGSFPCLWVLRAGASLVGMQIFSLSRWCSGVLLSDCWANKHSHQHLLSQLTCKIYL